MKIETKGERLKSVPCWVKLSNSLPQGIGLTDCKFTLLKLNKYKYWLGKTLIL